MLYRSSVGIANLVMPCLKRSLNFSVPSIPPNQQSNKTAITFDDKVSSGNERWLPRKRVNQVYAYCIWL